MGLAGFEDLKMPNGNEYVRRIKFVYTPMHGSWLNVAECELSCLTSQCLSDRRIGDIVTCNRKPPHGPIEQTSTDGPSIGNLALRRPASN